MTVHLHRNLSPLGRIALRKDANRYAMQCVRVLGLEGMYRVEATEGHMLVVVQGPDDGGGKEECLILRSDWLDVFKLGPKDARKLPLVMRRSKRDSKDIRFECGNQSYLTSEQEGRWPDVNLVLPKDMPLFTVPVNPGYLADILNVCADMQEAGNERVELQFYGSGKPIGVRARCGDGNQQSFDGLIMPLA